MNRFWVSDNDYNIDNDWSPASELAARTAWRNIQDGAAEDPVDVDLCIFKPEDPWLREKVPWLRMARALRSEREAYRRLSALQGTTIPRLLGTLHWRDPQLDAFEPAEHPMFADTPGLAIEFVEGSTLRDVAEGRSKSDSDWPTDAEERMSAKVLDIARTLGRYGVIHKDIRSANIILRSPSCDKSLRRPRAHRLRASVAARRARV